MCFALMTSLKAYRSLHSLINKSWDVGVDTPNETNACIQHWCRSNPRLASSRKYQVPWFQRRWDSVTTQIKAESCNGFKMFTVLQSHIYQAFNHHLVLENNSALITNEPVYLWNRPIPSSARRLCHPVPTFQKHVAAIKAHNERMFRGK